MAWTAAIPWGSILEAGASLGSSYMASSASAKGVREQNLASIQEAQKNRDFQEYMSSTAHQREVKDLRLAGLNPILSATGGHGASSPGGSVAPIESEQSGASLIKAQALNLASMTRLNNAKTVAEKAKAGMAKGWVGVPGFAKVPTERIASKAKESWSKFKNLRSNMRSNMDKVKTWFKRGGK